MESKLMNNLETTRMMNSSPTKAFVTFLAGYGDNVKGVVGLAKCLREVDSCYPLVVTVLPNVPEEHRNTLVSQGCVVREIVPVDPPENQTQFAMAYATYYSKLRIWEFVEFNKMIYLDSNTRVFQNIDHLFDLPDNYFYAVMDCFCEKRSHTRHYEIGYCQQCSNKVQWAENKMGPKPSLYFNACMFVFEPKMSTYHDLLSKLQVTQPTPFAEQDILNMYFKDIYKPIPPIDFSWTSAVLTDMINAEFNTSHGGNVKNDTAFFCPDCKGGTKTKSEVLTCEKEKSHTRVLKAMKCSKVYGYLQEELTKKVSDITNVEDVCAYKINGKLICFPKSRKKEGSKTYDSKTYNGKYKLCVNCNHEMIRKEQIESDVLYCSIKCKVTYPKKKSKKVFEAALGTEGNGIIVNPSSFRKRSRKGIPCRAPLS